MYSEEVRNKLLAEIHNRLAEISKFLEVGIAIFAKLDTDETFMLKDTCKKITITPNPDYIGNIYDYSISQDDDMDIGCNSAMGLFRERWVKKSPGIVCSPIGEDNKRTWPIDEKTKDFLTEDEIESRNKQEAE